MFFFFSFFGRGGDQWIKLSEFKLFSPKCVSKEQFYRHPVKKDSTGKCLEKTRINQDKPRGLAQQSSEHLFLIPPSVTSYWELDIVLGKYVYPGSWQMLQIRAFSLCFPESQLLNIYPHTTVSWSQPPPDRKTGRAAMHQHRAFPDLGLSRTFSRLRGPQRLVSGNLSLFPLPQNDTSGEYKKALLKLCGGDDE